jgi:hypothetical protein
MYGLVPVRFIDDGDSLIPMTTERRNIMDNKIKTVCNIIEGIILVDIIMARNTGPASTEALTVPCHPYNTFHPIECILVVSKGI